MVVIIIIFELVKCISTWAMQLLERVFMLYVIVYIVVYYFSKLNVIKFYVIPSFDFYLHHLIHSIFFYFLRTHLLHVDQPLTS